MTPAVSGQADEPALPDDAVEIGRVTGAWGIKGWIRVQPFSTQPQALFSSKRWFVKPPDGAPSTVAMPPMLRVVQAREQGDGVVASVQELPDRNAAEAMRGARVFIARSSFPTAGDGEFYWVDLIGLDVFNRQGEALGQVTGLLDTGAHSVLCVRPAEAAVDASPEAPERLIPFVAAYVDEVSLASRRIVVDWGLDY
jgi:16S rRNA processing protein RimM